MKKQITLEKEICDVCGEYERRRKCHKCNKVVCHNYPCEQKFGVIFDFMVKVTRLSTNVILCHECIENYPDLVAKLFEVKRLRTEWWALVEQYDKAAKKIEGDLAKEGLEDYW